MAATINIGGFGPDMTDWIVNVNPARLKFINKEIYKFDATLPPISSKVEQYDVETYHAVLRDIVAENWDFLKAQKAKGGSILNTAAAAKTAAKVMFGQKAKQIVFHHFPTVVVPDALVFNLPNAEKFLCAYRPRVKVKVKGKLDDALAALDVFYTSFNTPKGYPKQTGEALDILKQGNPKAKAMFTFHGYAPGDNLAKIWPALHKFDAWIGNSRQLGVPEHGQQRAAFLAKEDTILVTTYGEKGLNFESGHFHKFFPGVPVEEALSTPSVKFVVKGVSGAGDGTQGALVDTLTPLFNRAKNGGKIQKFYAAGRYMNATGAAATTDRVVTLRPWQAFLIRRGYNYLTAHNIPA
jgi:hypothetical protein